MFSTNCYLTESFHYGDYLYGEFVMKHKEK
jgi:hypothetical protein